MARKKRQTKKTPEQAQAPELKKEESHQIFTAKRLIIMFAALEILIIVLMFPAYHGRWHMNHAKAAARSRNYEKAYKHYKWLAKHTPAAKSASFHLELGNVCLATERYSEAIDHLETAVEKTEGQEGIHALLGFAFLKAGNKTEARKHLEKELERNPTNALANFNLGKMAFEAKRYPEATAYFSRVAYLPNYKPKLKPYWDTIKSQVLEQ